jgi:hypothetical protein
MRVKASAYRALGHLAPAVVDGMELWQVGVLLGNHEAAPGSDRQAEAERILSAKAAKVKAVERGRTT